MVPRAPTISCRGVRLETVKTSPAEATSGRPVRDADAANKYAWDHHRKCVHSIPPAMDTPREPWGGVVNGSPPRGTVPVPTEPASFSGVLAVVKVPMDFGGGIAVPAPLEGALAGAGDGAIPVLTLTTSVATSPDETAEKAVSDDTLEESVAFRRWWLVVTGGTTGVGAGCTFGTVALAAVTGEASSIGDMTAAAVVALSGCLTPIAKPAPAATAGPPGAERGGAGGDVASDAPAVADAATATRVKWAVTAAIASGNPGRPHMRRLPRPSSPSVNWYEYEVVAELEDAGGPVGENKLIGPSSGDRIAASRSGANAEILALV
jgi:hypothetical protein